MSPKNRLLVDQLNTLAQDILQRPSLALPMLQIKDVSNVITRSQHEIDVLLCVCSTEAETYPASQERRCRVRDDDDHNGRRAVLHHAMEARELTEIEDKQWDDRGGGVAVGDEAKLVQALMEVPRVERKAA